MTYRLFVAVLTVACIAALAPGKPTWAAAQSPAPPAGSEAPAAPEGGRTLIEATEPGPGAQQTREELGRILRQYSPALGEILVRDPSLLSDADYLEPYPALAGFLQGHPEVLRNPAFYFGGFAGRERTPEQEAMALMGGVLAGLAGLTAGAIFVGLIVWLVRGVADHRRWSRLLATQVALHTKFADRLTTNEEVLDYVKTPAVARFLEAGPVVEGPVQRPGPVVSRIVWPLQAGVVLFTLGLGLWLVRGLVLEEVASGFAVAGIIVMTLGLGFVAAASVAYLVSAQFGLAPERRQQS